MTLACYGALEIVGVIIIIINQKMNNSNIMLYVYHDTCVIVLQRKCQLAI